MQPSPAESSGQVGDTSPLAVKEAYPTWVGFVHQAEANSWNRFYVYLVFNSILILAWSTIYSQSNRPRCAAVVMVWMCVVGFASGPVWAWLGYRGRKHHTVFLEAAANIEAGAAANCQVCRRILQLREEDFPQFSSFYILIGTPGVITLSYIVLGIVSLVSQN
jgi:hypothetical protein